MGSGSTTGDLFLRDVGVGGGVSRIRTAIMWWEKKLARDRCGVE